MKYKFYILVTLVLILAFSTSLMAQRRGADKLTLKHDTLTVKGKASEFEILTYNMIYNPTSSSMTYRWVITNNSLPAGWSFALCDNAGCLDDIDSNEFTIAAGDSGVFEVHFYPGNIVGTGSLTFIIFPASTPYRDSKITHSICTAETSGGGSFAKVDFSMYPNPTRDYLNIRFNKRGNHSIEIYNVLGTRVMKRDASNTDKMRISLENLQSGMYVVLYRTDNGKVITKTISKE